MKYGMPMSDEFLMALRQRLGLWPFEETTRHEDGFAEPTYEQVRAQIIEAAYTLRASPGDLGPRLASGAMSDVKESCSYQEAKATHIPSAGAISRMCAVWDWVNTYLNKEAWRSFGSRIASGC